MYTEAHKRADAKYKKKNTRRFTLNLNKNHDAELIEFLESADNVNALLKQLVTEAMKKAL